MIDVKTVAAKVAHEAQVIRVLANARVLRPERPDRFLAGAKALVKWGPTAAGGYSAAAIRHPDAVAVVDEDGSTTFAEIDRRTNSIARGLRELGVGEGSGVAILCRNHRGFIEATVAVSKLGASVLYLNTGFAGPQLAEVLEREGAAAVIYDADFAELVEGCAGERALVVAWHDGLT
ncbi:MAG TPA: AMP-binding protein, partial [Acidimicrobiales bacterium]